MRCGRLAGRAWQEGHVAGAAGADRGRVVGADRSGLGLFCRSGVHRAVGLCGSRIGLCGYHRHLRHGHALGPHALESLQAAAGSSALASTQQTNPSAPGTQHEIGDRRRRSGGRFGGNACPPLVGRGPDRPGRARTGCIVRELRTALFHRRRDRPAFQAAANDSGPASGPLQPRRAGQLAGRVDRSGRQDRADSRSGHGARVRRGLRQADLGAWRAAPLRTSDPGHRHAGYLYRSAIYKTWTASRPRLAQACGRRW